MKKLNLNLDLLKTLTADQSDTVKGASKSLIEDTIGRNQTFSCPATSGCVD